jgi:hypothetical protein
VASPPGRCTSPEDPSVSHRNSSSRRKAYGRRQRELRERDDRNHLPEDLDRGWHDAAAASAIDPFGFLDPRLPRLRFAPAD